MTPAFMHSPVVRWSCLAAMWTAIGFILSAEVYFTLRVTKPDVAFLDVAVSQYARVILWAALAPVVLRLRRSIPLSTGRWVAGIGIHLMLSFALMAAYYLARIAYVIISEGEAWGDFWALARMNFFGRNLIDMAYYWAVLACGYTLEIYRRYKNEQIKAAQLESRLIESELQALRQQMHPHFLFNTMNTIAVLVREGRNDEAVTLLAKLGALLRVSLDSGREQEVTLRQEMEFLERYIDIQKMRFADRLAVETNVSPEAMEARIPNLLLQPLVENAIVHGITPKNAAGRVRVAGEVRDGRLHLVVSDNGCGFCAGGAGLREGIGLGNTRERVAKIYGGHGSLSVNSEPGLGTTVRIVLPFRA